MSGPAGSGETCSERKTEEWERASHARKSDLQRFCTGGARRLQEMNKSPSWPPFISPLRRKRLADLKRATCFLIRRSLGAEVNAKDRANVAGESSARNVY